MSLISDALKRQEQLRAPSAGAAQREVAAARPPEVAAAKPTVGNREEGTGKWEASNHQTSTTLSVSASSATRRENPTRPKQPSNRQTVKPSNPFIERERAAARRPNHSVLLMPVIGLLMLLVLLFLRREFVPSQPSQAVTVKKVESEKWEVESSGGPGAVPAAPPVDNPADAAVLSDLFPEEAENLGGPGAVPAATPIDIPTDESSVAIDSNRTQSIAIAPNQLSTLNSQAVEAPPQQPAWPTFTLTGIAVGRERIAVLSTGEMLLAGETSKCGVKVKKVNASTVVFAWGGETKTLRKGEHSDKPAD